MNPSLSMARESAEGRGPTLGLPSPLVVQPFSVDTSAKRWPDAAEALRAELADRPGRLALLCGAGADRAAEILGAAIGWTPLHVGRVLTAMDAPPNPEAVREVLSNANLLLHCEILFDPELATDPLQLLRALARRSPRVAVWPGRIEGGRATYSSPGRRDHYDRPLSDAVVLRPRPFRFPDEVPYTLERIL